MATMTAALWEGPNRMRIAQVEKPEPGLGDAVVLEPPGGFKDAAVGAFRQHHPAGAFLGLGNQRLDRVHGPT